MSVIVKDKNGRRFVITKGAPDVLLGLSESVLWGGKQQYLNEELKMLSNPQWNI